MKKKDLLIESSVPAVDLVWGEALDAAFFTALTSRLTTPIKNLPAFKYGLINAQGKILRMPKSKEERRALTYIDMVALFMRQTMGGRVQAIYNMYRQARMNPAFIQAAARSVSLRFTKYYDLKYGFVERPTPEAITGGMTHYQTSLSKPF